MHSNRLPPTGTRGPTKFHDHVSSFISPPLPLTFAVLSSAQQPSRTMRGWRRLAGAARSTRQTNTCAGVAAKRLQKRRATRESTVRVGNSVALEQVEERCRTDTSRLLKHGFDYQVVQHWQLHCHLCCCYSYCCSCRGSCCLFLPIQVTCLGCCEAPP